MRILLTNDDGIHAPGLAALHRVIKHLGEVHVVAPATVQSATSHAITFHRPMAATHEVVAATIEEHNFKGIAVDGRPADCVKLAVAELVPKPIDLVISGMNAGANVGINVIYSGTVAAAREAAFLGIPALAVSLHLGPPPGNDFEKAASQVKPLLEKIVAGTMEPHTLLTINIPRTIEGEEPLGVRVVPISTSPLADRFVPKEAADGVTHYEAMDGFKFVHTPADSDVDALFQRYITVTPLHFDLTEHEAIPMWAQRLVD